MIRRSVTAWRVLGITPLLVSSMLGCASSPSSPESAQAGTSAGSDEPELAKNVVPREKPKPPPVAEKIAESPPPVLSRPWEYVMPVDHGVRSDKGGKGAFLAPRYHGRHNGLDLLAPLGTAVQSPCDGKARAGRSGSFGRYVQIVCKLPSELSSGRAPYASLFYSHLSRATPSAKDFERIRAGQTVGAVGKSGNASGSDIAPHLHLEIIIHDDEDDAESETHSGRNQNSSRAAREFVAELERKCLAPNGFQPRDSALARARRLDPFVVLTCLAPGKPAFSTPRGSLAGALERWSDHYRAKTFDVNVGRRSPADDEQPTAQR